MLANIIHTPSTLQYLEKNGKIALDVLYLKHLIYKLGNVTNVKINERKNSCFCINAYFNFIIIYV